MSNIKLIQGDCLEKMKDIPDKSVDMILCDLPYGTTNCKWDTVIPFDKLWEQYEKLIKDNGAIVLFGSQPFTTKLINSNFEMFKYCLVWNKIKGSNIIMANKRPLKSHEDIIIFYSNQPTYNPQMTFKENGSYDKRKFGEVNSNTMGFKLKKRNNKSSGERFPISILEFSKNWQPQKCFHPTQKPVALFEYLIKTYTNEGDLVLDNCAGSGTTGVACKNLSRDFVLIEKEPEYCKIAEQRLRQDLLL